MEGRDGAVFRGGHKTEDPGAKGTGPRRMMERRVMEGIVNGQLKSGGIRPGMS